MSDRAVLIESIFIVRWSLELTAQEVRQVTLALTDARRDLQRQLALVDITDAESAPPDQATLDEFMRQVPAYSHACSCAFAVVSTSSPHHRLQVGSLEAMSAFSAIPSEICVSLEDALRNASLAVSADFDSVLAAARRSPLLAPLL